jgi:unsaturated chondroitin disaccharide hydrolase
MALKIDRRVSAEQLLPKIRKLFEVSAPKLLSLQKGWNPAHGTPVFTVRGKYSSRGWTEWTQGFQFGSALLQFDATGDEQFLAIGRRGTLDHMATHVSHIGVHDHGFNNVSTYGNLWRMMREGRLNAEPHEKEFCELALKVSGAVQAARWTALGEAQGYIYSFNGPHSLFVDTVRSLRALGVAHQLGHVLMGERDRRISLLERLLQHAHATARYNIYYGEQRDSYDVPGRTAHECIFNTNDGSYRCPSTQQGYSPFSTWTRGLAWAILGFAEELEFLKTVSLPNGCDVSAFLRAARATADFYILNSCSDGIPAWDTGAPNLSKLGRYLDKAADPFNPWEPVDSSAAAIAAQGLLRLGNYLSMEDPRAASRYRQAALTVTSTLLNEPYLSTSSGHQGLLLHSVYHRPNGWDYVAPRQKVPNNESSMWGDYHLRELALLVQREATNGLYPTFFDPSLKAAVPK